ncbi:anoctamin-10 isoform 1-T2 [Clarias gariepinus]|uniref:anoctamin-10 n=1 Tax=Clarias gariepinus TaxID=13013 RepID=UPI00234CECB7|nr:anoctamin-10 [Clarias gariepinus]XP_053361016.1 anoctamin-10 [Clarias gariepinus]XP_053361017.1 anoctamin-10 [Clarias gariepinus]
MSSPKQQQDTVSSVAATVSPESWSKVSCPCCVTSEIEPLVLIQLAETVDSSTKQWIMAMISASHKAGGAHLMVHPGEDASWGRIAVAAPRCTLLKATEELGLCKADKEGNMIVFTFHDRNNFDNIDNMQKFLTLAERQYIVQQELESMRAVKEQRIPGIPGDKGILKARQNIFQKLKKAGVIQDVFPLCDEKTLNALGKEWYLQKRLWGQPLDAIHAYFGGSIAYYFSFLDFYTWALVPPAILGLLITFFLPGTPPLNESKADNSTSGSSSSDDHLSVSSHMVQAVFSMIWSTVFMELWKRRSAVLSYRWGTLTLTEHFQDPRPGFQGELGINPVTGRKEPLFPDWQRQKRIGLVSMPVVGLFLGFVVLGMWGFYLCESTMASFHKAYGSIITATLSYLPSVIHIVYTNMLGNAYRTVALKLTEWENHREESSFQNHHTAKVLVFTFFNNFAVLFHIAIFKQDLHLLRKRLSSLLILSQLVNQFTEVVVPYIVDRFYSSSQNELKEDDPAADHMQAEGSLPPFPGLFLEYIELLVQFGYLSLFSCVYPLTAVLLLINNITEIRGDAYKICRLFRKPFSPPEASIGVWQVAFETLAFVSVISNCWLLFLAPRIRAFTLDAGLNLSTVLIFFILVEHVLIVAKLILAFIIPDEPDWIQIKKQQIEYRTMKALKEQKVKHSPVAELPPSSP